MKTLRISILPLIVALALSQQGCGTTPLAKAQQVVHASAVDFNDFVQFEKANRDALWKLNPAIKHTADKLRHCTVPGPGCEPNGSKWVNSAIALVDSYKNNRTPENQANMGTAIAVIQELVNQLSGYFLNPQVAAINPAIAMKYSPTTKIVP